MFACVRSVARSAAVARQAWRPAAMSVRPLTVASFRMDPAGTQSKNMGKAMPNHPPEGPHYRTAEDGTQWVDWRPANLRNIQAERSKDGVLVGMFEGEEVVFPDQESTTEWTLSTPTDFHLFEEAPIIKMYEEESVAFPQPTPAPKQ